MKFELVPGRIVGESGPCFVIAEIGQNHQGDISIATELIRVAAAAQVDCVKFQKSDLKDKFTAACLNRPYSSVHSFGPTYGEHKSKLEFTDEQFRYLQQYAQNEGLAFTASAMDIKSVDVLLNWNVPFIKIGSGDTNNFLLLDHISKKNCNVILSTGMQHLDIVQQAYDILTQQSNAIGLLHCVSSYPTPLEQINLNVIKTYHHVFPRAVIGYSGHELGYAPTLASVAIGSKIVERHITLDKSMKGNDHQCSLDPKELTEMVAMIRQIETSMGSNVKERQPSEEACYEKLGKSIVATKNISQGTKLSMEHIAIKVSHPRGLDAHLVPTIIGKKVRKNIEFDYAIMLEDLETV
ncbi:Sialic acid synthase [Halotydeus destructor]|nr:Sialic acid synthase [Halotydeus destructor]